MNSGTLLGWLVLAAAVTGLGQVRAAPVALPDAATLDAPPPVIELVVPETDRPLSELSTIEVLFSEPVAGLDASDLLINGAGATNVIEFAPGQLVFFFAQPPDGTVSVGWRANHGITDQATGSQPFVGDRWTYALDSGAAAPEVSISEFMVDNSKTLRDEDGDASDWIEILNGHDGPVNLDGWFLTDTATNLTKWRFPDISLGPGEFLVVFASEKDRTNVLGRLHTNFKLSAEGEYLALVSPRTNVVSGFAPVYPAQRTDVSYGRAQGAPNELGYFAQPTPGAPNAQSGPGFAPDVQFSRKTATFLQPFTLTLSTGVSNAAVRFTLDGSLPTNSSPAYVRPIAITNSVQVRARAYQDGLLPGPPHTETFLLLSNNLVSLESDLPILVLHSLGKGAPTASRQNFAHATLYEPVNGVTSLTNAPTFVSRSGIKIRGSSTEGLAKSSFALELWDEFNQGRNQEMLGLPAESDWVLYAPDIYEPVLIHNPFIHQLSRDMGRYSPRTRFVEVYLNKGTGPVSAANYNGIYVLEEKIKIGPHRVAIDKLQPGQGQPPEVTGGYLLKIDRLDPGDRGLNAGGQSMAYVEPKEREILTPQRDPQEQFIKGYFNNFSRALNGSNWLDPLLGYAAYIDVDAWIDFHVLEVLSGNVDAIVLSTYFHKPRNGKIVFGPHWDFDRALGSTDGRDANPRNWQTGPFFSGWWSRLCRDPDFWQKWVDRYQELRLSYFSRTHINALIDRLADEVRQAQPRERQKWRVSLRGGSYQSEVNLMKNWLSNRLDFIDKQLVQPPVASAAAGRVTAGFTLTLSGPTNATIYYTLDGSDPRLRQGNLSPGALTYRSPITVADNVRIVARSRNLGQRQTGGPPISSLWSRPVAATFVVRPPPLMLTELMFHPASAGLPGTNSALDFEFLELKNVSAETLDLAGYRFTNGINFTFTSTGPVRQLPPGQRVLLVSNLAAFQTRYPSAVGIAGQFAGTLGRGGSHRLTLVGPLQEPIFDLTYQERWQQLADGYGFSLVPVSETIPPEALAELANWRLSAHVGGSPGEPDPAPLVLPKVFINELLPNPLASATDALELFNASGSRADISGWSLTDDLSDPMKFRLPAGSVIEPGGYLHLTSFPLASGTLAFSKFGEQVYLFSADAEGNLTGWFHGFTFGAAEDGVSFGRYVTSTGAEAFVAQRRPTFGAANSGPRVGPVVINEIMTEASALAEASDRTVPYIELWNISDQPVPLFDPAQPTNTWHLRGTVDFDLPANQTLPPKSFLVLVGFDPQGDPASLARFLSRYGSQAAGLLLGPWQGHLDAAAGTIRLLKPSAVLTASGAVTSHILVEEVSYSSEAPWPQRPAEGNLALLRLHSNEFANDPVNWVAAFPSPGDTDTDRDGLPDSWEAANGLNSNSALGADGAEGDPDLDGSNNSDEFRNGTAPRDPASHLQLGAGTQSGREIRLVFPVIPGRSYTVEFCDSVTLGTWHILQRFVASPGSDSISIVDTPLTTQRYYRLTTP